MHTKKIIVIIGLVLAILTIMWIEHNRKENTALKTFTSAEYGISFDYPVYYFLEERGEGENHIVILTEDTEENRMVREGNSPGRDGPVAITLQLFPNSKNQAPKDWIKDSTSSNYRLSPDGKIEEIIIDRKIGAKYSSSGLYESKNVVVTVKNRILMITGQYLDPTDTILSDYETILKNLHLE